MFQPEFKNKESSLSPLRNPSCQQGNTLLEYGVVGMLVVATVVGVLMGVGGNLNAWFAGLKQDMRQTANAAENQARVVEQGRLAATVVESARQAAQNTASNSANLVLESVSDQAPQTVGARGTEALSQEIRQLANKYLATGNLSPADHDLVTQVANKGHEIAVLQGLLEGARRDSGGSAQTYNNYRFNFNGQQYSPDALMGVLGSTITEFQGLKSQAQASLNVKNSLELLGALEISGGQIIINGGDVRRSCGLCG
jgi:Flp pilus assembly pilin Flp